MNGLPTVVTKAGTERNARPWPALTELCRTDCAFADRPILVTGATGFLAGHFLHWWRRLGGRSVSLVRAKSHAEALARLCRAQAHIAEADSKFATAPLSGIEALSGDLRFAHCGVAQSDRARLRSLDLEVMWHFAANLQFDRRLKSRIRRDNVIGTRNALDLARAVGARRFVYVSTVRW
jgi:thioester reductase-like protein